ncbi:hypothetical protein GCM10009847_04550 [Leucobacter tardus]
MLVVISSVLIAFVVNGALEMVTDMHLAVRWALAILASIIFTAAIESMRRARSRNRDRDWGSRDRNSGASE